MKPVIEIANLSKRYMRTHSKEKATNLREALVNACKNPLHRLHRGAGKEIGNGSFWALKDINLQVNEGDVVGVIGSNGAGKSTLLKILSRITEPTTGRILVRGRMASLLEVGTGFHPELTGRENIFLNGAILGMDKQEIRSKFDEIVAFAEIEEFLDTPVKHYSSGMYVRLAFAVSAHLEPEILVVDEVLAVGDIAFQKKCLGKMTEVSSQGRTVLFVSHNMAAIENLCTRGVVLQHGQMMFEGSAANAIQSYLGSLSSATNDSGGFVNFQDTRKRAPQYSSLLQSVELLDGDGLRLRTPLSMGQKLRLRVCARFDARMAEAEVGIGFDTIFGQRLFTVSTALDPTWDGTALLGDRQFLCEIPEFPLNAGEYKLKIYIRSAGVVLDAIEDAFRIQVVESDFFGTGRQPYGAFAQRSHWSCEKPTQASQVTEACTSLTW